MVTKCTGSLTQLTVVEMSWGKKSTKKTSVLTNFSGLIHPTQWSHGHHEHRQTISASSGQNELRKTRPNWSMLTKTILSNHMISLSQYFQNNTTLHTMRKKGAIWHIFLIFHVFSPFWHIFLIFHVFSPFFSYYISNGA